MADGCSWNECCEEAANSLKYVAAFDISAYSIQKWNWQYHTNETFPHTNKYVVTGINPEPNLFTLFPEAKAHLLTFAAVNLDAFSIKSVQNYLNETLILSESTMCWYLDHLNYKYDVRKKSYFMDGHEHKDACCR